MPSKYKILIVDDEVNILMSLEYLLRKKGYEVFIARNGSEALRIAEEEVPDLVLLDIMMPDVDGYEVCTKLKAAEDSVPKVIFLTAKSKKSDIEKGYEVGADLYLLKPFSTRELTKEIENLLNPS